MCSIHFYKLRYSEANFPNKKKTTKNNLYKMHDGALCYEVLLALFENCYSILGRLPTQ